MAKPRDPLSASALVQAVKPLLYCTDEEAELQSNTPHYLLGAIPFSSELPSCQSKSRSQEASESLIEA